MKHYRRPADVIYPPVNTEFYTLDRSIPREAFFLIVSAFAPYKKIELAIEAFNRLQLPLKIIGQGQDVKRLQALAQPIMPDEIFILRLHNDRRFFQSSVQSL